MTETIPPDPLKTIAIHEAITKVNREAASRGGSGIDLPLVSESDTFERALLEFGFFIERTTPAGTGG